MHRTVDQSALLIALLFKKSKAKRARLSDRTIRVLSKRTNLRSAFIDSLSRALDDLGLHMIELERGGFGLIPVSALDGADPILAKNFISAELKAIRSKKVGEADKVFAQIRSELMGSEDEGTDED